MTMTNAEWCIKNKIEFYRLHVNRLVDVNEFEITIDNKTISEIHVFDSSETDAILAWLDMEHVEPILDDAERRYLSAVIRPFKDQIISIYKEQFGFNHESIIIEYYDFDRNQSTLCLPQFEKGSMYAGMKTGWRYTLEELGL